jgi:hypothetical protein
MAVFIFSNLEQYNALSEFCNNSSIIKLCQYDDEYVQRLISIKSISWVGGVYKINDHPIYLVLRAHGYYWKVKSDSESYIICSTEEIINILPEDAKKEILFNIDLFR